MADSRRYELAKPLLDQCYIGNLEKEKNHCETLLYRLIENETPEGEHTDIFWSIRDQYFASGKEFSKNLKKRLINN